MTLFLASVALVLIVSAFCSLSEAALYSVRVPFVRQLASEGSRSGAILEGFKRNMERPITAILIVNTAANTAGAAVAGAEAQVIFGDDA
ncbi:MAG: CNNM domain-containing protein, partial [Acidobacteriota bacterium]